MKESDTKLSRRERQILDVLFALGEASAQQVLDNLTDPPSYSTVRALLGRMEDKKVIQHRADGAKYIYSPIQETSKARQSALQRLLRVFFGGSAYAAVNTLLDEQADKLSADEIAALEAKIRSAKARNKG